MTADLEFHWWMTFSSCCYIFWLYKLQQKPPKHPKWSQPARSLHEPAGKLMYWTRGVQRSLGCWMCGEIAFFIVEKPWLQSCFWDAHSWVARAIALLLPHQGTARPRTTRRPWLQRPQKSQKTKSTGVLTLFEFDWFDWSKNQDTNFYSKSRRHKLKSPKIAEIRKLLGSMNARDISLWCTRVARWLLPPIVASKSSRIW